MKLCHELLCLCLVCIVTSSSGLECYTYVWIENLYLDLVSFIIPTSSFFKFDFRHLYLLLVCNVIPTSVMATSAFAKLDLRHVIPTSGIGKTDIIPLSVISTYGAPGYGYEKDAR